MNVRRVVLMTSVVAACAAAFAGGVYTGTQRARNDAVWVEGRLISNAIDSVRANALDTLASDELVRRAVSGMLRELKDPYAALLRSDGFERYRGTLQGEGRGLGLSLRRQAGEVTVARVVRGSPAWTSGLRAGDRLLSVNDVPVEQAWTRRDSSERSDTSHFVVQRAPGRDTVQVRVVRRTWHNPAVSDAAIVADQVGYVHLTTVSARAAEELEQEVEQLIERGAQSLILDLRGNGGGLYDEGVRVASLFLPRGAVVASLAGRTEADLQVSTVRRTRWATLPLTVLVDAHTASAAELIAAAMRDHKRAMLVGTRTYGKGVVQRVVRLSPDVALRLTTARWLPPGGEILERRAGQGLAATGGIAPDVLVEDASRNDPFSVPSNWGANIVALVTRTADSVAMEALRDAWVVRPTSMLETRARTRAAQLAPRRGMSETERTTWIGVATRLATVRVLEVRNDNESLVRYRAREDAALRAGLEVVAPGLQAVSVRPADVRARTATTRRYPRTVRAVAPAPAVDDTLR